MNHMQYLLGKLAEESAELAQAALKTQQFGPNSVCHGQALTNAQLVDKKYNDVIALVSMLNSHSGLGLTPNPDLMMVKVNEVKEYQRIARSLGMVE